MPRYTPTAKDYMSPIPRSIAPHEPLSSARDAMEAKQVRHLTVVEDGRLVGVISERDLRVPPGVEGRSVGEIMTPKPYTVEQSMPLNKVARDMANRKIGSAVVMDGNDVAGILTAVDALHALADALEGKHARPFELEAERQPPRGRTRPSAKHD